MRMEGNGSRPTGGSSSADGDGRPAPETAHRGSDPLDWSRSLLEGRLPDPCRERWQPLRAGLLNVYLFADERFPFADGRLLLRGTNATGKSRVLAFLLPFLLDGSLHPTRLEPDRDATRQVAWNLLMGEHRDRLGYSWVELGRFDDSDGPQFLTLGCGLRAVQDRGIVEHWFFITSRRVDVDLELVTPHRTALTRRQLIEALGDRGQVFERARDYQRAVDEALFRLGDRYPALIDLLLQLRQPQLARKLDLEHLESALRESLPPLSGHLMDTAAEAFRSLDADRRQLQASREALSQTRSFLSPYRQHVRIGLRRAAERVRNAHNGFEAASRRIRSGVQEREQLEAAHRERRRAVEASEQAALAAEARIRALEQSEEARAAGRLDDKRQTLATAEQSVQRLRAAFEQASQQAAQHADRVADYERRLDGSRDELARQSQLAAELAAPEQLAAEHRRRLEELCQRERLGEHEAQQAVAALGGEIERWRRYAARLAELDAQLDQQDRAWRDARKALDDRERDHLEATERVAEQGARVERVRDELWQQIGAWYGGTAELRTLLPDPDAVEAAWWEWAERAEGPDPWSDAADAARRRLLDAVSGDEAEARHQHELLLGRRDELRERLERLLDGGELPPAAPATRDPAARAAGRGAALWQLVDFAPTVPEAERAGWEAALEASGLLDAWVEPDGRLRDRQRCDTVLDAGSEPPLVPDRQLARVLVPVEGPMPVPAGVVREVLERIGVGGGASRVWVDRSGQWQNGPLHGRWQKPDAQYIGPAARQRHRQRQIELVRAELAGVDRQRQQLADTLQELGARRQRIEDERLRMPGAEQLRRVLAELSTIERHASEAERRRRESAEREADQRETLERLTGQRDRDAADMGLSAWCRRSTELVRSLDRYESQLRLVERLLAEWATGCDRLDRARREHEQAVAAQQAAERDWRAADEQCQRYRVELKTLEESIGAAAVEITRRLAEARRQLTECRERWKVEQEQAAELQSQLAVLRSNLERYQEELEQHDQQRREAVERLENRAARGLLEVAQLGIASPDASWTLTLGVEVARAIERESQSVRHDDGAWQRSQQRVHESREELRAHLSGQDTSPDAEFLDDGLQLVYVLFRGAVLRIDQLAAGLEEEVQAHERVLSERERRIFEDFLLGEVGSELHRRMHEATELVDRMNREVARRPMSTGMQMRFRWELAEDAAADLRAARDVLMRMQETWSIEERESLIRFLQRQIQTERQRDESASWQEQLRAALDYRKWHALRIERRSAADQPWRLLTRRTYGAGSGGEKAIALTIPQLAAAAAYYSSADKHAPRFILLDEAFAGISVDNRSSCLELLVSFDLDAVMTSENERGCYPCVPALAICRLSRVPDLPVVLNELFVWNGKQQLGPAVPGVDHDGARVGGSAGESRRGGARAGVVDGEP